MANSTPPEVGAILRQIPSVDEVLGTAGIQQLLAALSALGRIGGSSRGAGGVQEGRPGG